VAAGDGGEISDRWNSAAGTQVWQGQSGVDARVAYEAGAVPAHRPLAAVVALEHGADGERPHRLLLLLLPLPLAVLLQVPPLLVVMLLLVVLLLLFLLLFLLLLLLLLLAPPLAR
jgi:hypothetical protein